MMKRVVSLLFGSLLVAITTKSVLRRRGVLSLWDNCRHHGRLLREEQSTAESLKLSEHTIEEDEEGYAEYYDSVEKYFVFPAYTLHQGVPSNLGQRAIFYNAYMNPKNLSLSYDIISEQLLQRQRSKLVANEPFYYYTVGASNYSMPPCSVCHHLGHSDSGFEQKTLQAMYEYCILHPNHLVVYLHNKGSFNDNPTNHRMRRHLTKAVFSPECLLLDPQAFDICAAQFTGYPFAHSYGNIFTAQCSYVRKLIPPLNFERVQSEIFKEMLQNMSLPWNQERTFGDFLVMERPSWVGLGRFALEHWIGSHPMLRPASVYPNKFGTFNYGEVPLNYNWTPVLRKEVRKSLVQQRKAPKYFQRDGRLYLYKKWYGEAPPEDSWVWRFYVV